jgi:hypothetical protein
MTPQGKENAPPSQASGVTRRDAQLVGDLIEGQTEPAKAVDRNQTIEAPIRVRVGSQGSDEVQLSISPGARPAKRSLHEIPRPLELAGSDLTRLRPATTRLRKGCEFALIDVVRAMRAPDGAQPAVADPDSKSLDVAADLPRGFGQVDHADPVHEGILQVQGDLDMSEWGFSK